MKGPFERLKYDLRRVWECPNCGHKQRTDGTVTSAFCRCGKPNTNPPVGMKLIGDGPRRLVPIVAPPPRETAIVAVENTIVAAEGTLTQVDVIVVTPPAASAVVDTESLETGSPPPPPAEPAA